MSCRPGFLVFTFTYFPGGFLKELLSIKLYIMNKYVRFTLEVIKLIVTAALGYFGGTSLL